jgi:hypothetical protein
MSAQNAALLLVYLYWAFSWVTPAVQEMVLNVGPRKLI